MANDNTTMRGVAFTLVAFTLPLFAQQSAGVRFEVRIANGQTQFHVGEVIPVDLMFSSTGNGSYSLSLRNYDRSGRVDSDVFSVAPEGRDPLREYFSFGFWMIGGMSGSRQLTGEAQTIREDLNEWVALNRPGHYLLHVTSGRVVRVDLDKPEPLTLRSNTLEFDVTEADPLWRQEKLNSALAVLEDPSPPSTEKTAAARVLRFLDSPESVRELVRQLGKSQDGETWNCEAGLLGSVHADLALEALERQLVAPDTGITGSYIYLFARLRVGAGNGGLSAEARSKAVERLSEALYMEVSAAIAAKQGEAKATTIRTLLSRSLRPGQASQTAELPGEAIAASFASSSMDQQERLLTTFPERIHVAAMVAPPKKLAEQPKMDSQTFRSAVLRALYDVDPAEGRRQILAEIEHPHLDHEVLLQRAEALGVLPDETLPQFDDLLMTRLEQKDSRSLDLDAQLLGRYATKAILSRAKAAYEEGASEWDCAARDGFLVYFLRTQPGYGVRQVTKGPSFCLPNSLAAVVRMKRWDDVESSIVRELNGKDLNRGRQAAETLAKFGGRKAEVALWERLRRFHEEWEAREPGLERDSDASSFQYGLVEALGRAQGWVLTNQQVAEAERLTLGQEKENVRQWHYESPVDVFVNAGSGSQFHVRIHQYMVGDLNSLSGKLSQYPKGTRFAVTSYGSPEQLSPVLQAMDAAAREYGFVIEPAAARK